jgi:hypothetical protein
MGARRMVGEAAAATAACRRLSPPRAATLEQHPSFFSATSCFNCRPRG